MATRNRPRPAATPAEELWGIDEIAVYFGCSKYTIHVWMKRNPRFPRPLRLGGKTLRWRRQVIQDWALAQEDAPAAAT